MNMKMRMTMRDDESDQGTHKVMDLGSLEMRQNKYTLMPEMSRRLCSTRPVRIWSPANKKVVGGQHFPKGIHDGRIRLATTRTMTEVQAQLMLYYKSAPRAYSGFDASEGDETNFSHNCDGNARTHDKLKQQQQLSNNQAVSTGPGICLAVKFKANFQHTNIQNLRLASDHKTIIQEICSSTHKRFTPSFRGIAAGQAVEDMEVLSSNLL